MTDPLESRLRRAAESLDAAAERWHPSSSDEVERPEKSRRWLVTTSAAATLIAGIIAVAVIATDEKTSAPLATAPAEPGQTDVTAAVLPPTVTGPQTARDVTGPSQPAPSDELTLALKQVGADVDGAPRGAKILDGAFLCGVSRQSADPTRALEPPEPAECFVTGQGGPDSWVLVLEQSTIEGDPIVSVWRSRPGRAVQVFSDTSRDAYGSGTWESSPCARFVWERDKSGAWVFGCSDVPAVQDPTTTSAGSPAPSSLESALIALGVDVANAPAGAIRLDAEYCGVDRWRGDLSEPETVSQRCLVERYEAGEAAIAVNEWYTPEGSPIVQVYRADPAGVVDVYTDYTRDPVFGSGEWSTDACDSVTFGRDGLPPRGCGD